MPTLYPKLAITGMVKNKQLYIPYFFACSLLMMVFYITNFLAKSEFVQNYLPEGTMVGAALEAGWIVLTAFSALFMFYMNTFLLKRRKTEFGLYNVLGMGKSNIMIVLVCEVGMVFAGSFLLGTCLGIMFSKLVEILVIRMLGGENVYDFSVNGLVILEEFCVYLALFGIILVRGMRQIRLNDSIKLLRSQNQGDEPPKANVFLAILGFVLLIAGYVLANIVDSWIWAILAFFGALLLIIAATYILFISGSAVVCKLLKKNTRFYYKKNHFFAVSQLSSRMKNNGAGLASICILSTMVLIVFSAVGGLYMGGEYIIRNNHPREFSYRFICDDRELVSECEEILLEPFLENGLQPQNVVRYRYIDDNRNSYIYRNNKIITTEMAEEMTEEEWEKAEALPHVFFNYVSISEYNAVMGENLSVNRGEALILRTRSENKNELYDLIPVKGEVQSKDEKNISTGSVETKKWCDTDYFKCVGAVDDFVVFDGEDLNDLNKYASRYKNRYVFLNDEDFEEQCKRRSDIRKAHEATERYTHGTEERCETYFLVDQVTSYYYGLDLGCSLDLYESFYWDAVSEARNFMSEKSKYIKDGKDYKNFTEIYQNEAVTARSEFYAQCKGMLFLGGLFCTVFIAAAILMMYYKQITEGHEDRARFHILRQVGMTDKEVRSTINSQVLIMFFMPLIAAGVHTIFAFGLISKLLLMSGYVKNKGFLALAILVCYLVYAVIYTVAYKLTSRAYYRIIS